MIEPGVSGKSRLVALQVSPAYYPATIYGGPIFSIHGTSLVLAASGVEIRVATTNANGDSRLAIDTKKPVQLAPHYTVRYYEDTIINRFSWAFILGLPREIRAVDLVHLQDVFSTHAAWTFFLSAVMRKPLVISSRGVLTPWGLLGRRRMLKRFWLNGLVRPLIWNRAQVIWHATAEVEREEILAQFPFASVVVIPNGIDTAHYAQIRRLPRDDYLETFFPDYRGDKSSAIVLIGMGRLHEKKAFDVAIRALADLVTTHKDAILLIAGADDGHLLKLQQIARDTGTTDRIAFVGELQDGRKLDFLAGADLFLFPTHNENFGMSCLEALAVGLPVVASRHAPWRDVENFRSGRWVANDEAAFCEAARELLSRDFTMLRASCLRHAATFDISTTAAAMRRAYSGLCYEP